MVFISDGPLLSGQKSVPGAVRPGQIDPVRFAVHASLALYLMPVIAIVCLIGGTSILAGKVARLAARSGLGSPHRERDGLAKREAKPRLIGERGRSEAIH